MKQIRCSLCNGIIVNGRCSSCGMYYREDQGRYYLNSRREGKKEIGVNKNKKESPFIEKTRIEKPRTEKPGTEKLRTEKPRTEKPRIAKTKDETSQKNKGKKIWILFLILMGLLGSIFSDDEDEGTSEYIRNEQIEDETDSNEDEYFHNPDLEQAGLYTNEVNELREEGDRYDIALTAGMYIVGCHIPEGNYTIQLTDMDDFLLRIDIFDEENGITEFLYPSEYPGGILYNVHLHDGATVFVENKGTVLLISENAQITELEEGVSKETLYGSQLYGEQELLVGEDIEPGVYELSIEDGSATVNVESEESVYSYELSSESNLFADSYHNMILLNGDRIWVEEMEPHQFIMISSEEMIYPEHGVE